MAWCACSVMTNSLPPRGLEPAPCPWDFPGKNTRVGCHFLLQGISPTLESNPCFLYWQAAFTTEPPDKPTPYIQAPKQTQFLFHTHLYIVSRIRDRVLQLLFNTVILTYSPLFSVSPTQYLLGIESGRE